MTFDETEPEPITEPDTENATRLNPSEGEAPENDPDFWNRLSKLNTGAVENSLGGRDSWDHVTVRKQERLRSWDVISGQLELNDWGKRRGRDIFANLTLEKFGVDMNMVAYCLGILVVRGDSRSRRSFHPQRRDRDNDDLFLTVADDHDFDKDRVDSVMQRLIHKLSDNGVEV